MDKNPERFAYPCASGAPGEETVLHFSGDKIAILQKTSLNATIVGLSPENAMHMAEQIVRRLANRSVMPASLRNAEEALVRAQVEIDRLKRVIEELERPEMPVANPLDTIAW